MSETGEASPEDVEVDVWWGGYAGRAMLPSFLACAVASAGVIGLAVYLVDTYDLPGDEVRYAVYVVVGLMWAVLLLRWGLRMVGVNYRVTTRRIYCWKSLRAEPGRPVELTEVFRVVVEQSWWERLLGVGRVRLLRNNGEAALILSGSAQPRRVAALLGHCAKEAKER